MKSAVTILLFILALGGCMVSAITKGYDMFWYLGGMGIAFLMCYLGQEKPPTKDGFKSVEEMEDFVMDTLKKKKTKK